MTSRQQPTRQTAGHDEIAPDIGAAVARIAVTAQTVREAGDVPPDELVDRLTLLHRAQADLAAIEPVLIAAARRAGVSWQALAPALGVASRQAAERRYLRLVPAAPDLGGSTGDSRVRAERDRRAGHRAVTRWANDNTADLRRLAGQITGLTDLNNDAAHPIERLHRALANTDASALPALLADTHRHLHRHPDLADQVAAVTNHTQQVRHDVQQLRDNATS